MTSAQLTLVAKRNPSALDSRRGVVRLHPEVLDALGMRAWDAVRLSGTRDTAALAAPAPVNGQVGDVLVDDLTLSNLELIEGSEVGVTVREVAPARLVKVAGSRMSRRSLTPDTLRLALIGKVVTSGDAVSLLPQDLAPPSAAHLPAARRRLSAAIGGTWTSELLTITATEPADTVAIGPSTVVTWYDETPNAQPGRSDGSLPEPAASGLDELSGPAGRGSTRSEPSEPSEATGPSDSDAAAEPAEQAVPAVAELVGAGEAARTLGEWLDLALQRPELLAKLGAAPRLGVLLSGPEGVGKATLVHSVGRAEGIPVVQLRAAELVVLDVDAARARLTRAAERTCAGGQPGILLLTDVDTLLPASARGPSANALLRTLGEVLEGTAASDTCAVVATTAHPESVDPRLRAPELLDRDLTLGMPQARERTELLRILLRDTPLEPDIDLSRVAERTPGFVVADLIALRRDAALRAAIRQRDEPDPRVAEQDLLDAAATVRPVSMSDSDSLNTGGLSLDDVGDMAAAKQTLTETVLWPLRYPDSFTRLGIEAPKGVLLHGPPGTGKTFLVRALAGTGALNVFTVKGAELMNKWVGESERAVRELFKRATDAAPALIFLDEVDALAPARGQSGDSGVSDRVVAALLTELDGIEPVRAVVVLAATNRPELVDPALLRPGRLERQIEVPLPDAEARAEILRASARNTPLAPDVDLDEIATALHGYSAADCAALIREAALTALRESLTATQVTRTHLETARTT